MMRKMKMEHWTIKKPFKMPSINRTIRISPECFEQITEISKNTGVSFNQVVPNV